MIALITGASSGLGLEFARILAREGYDLILTARNLPPMEHLAKELEARHQTRFWIFTQDLSDLQAPEALYRQVEAAGLKVDLLVNNAGFGTFGSVAESDLKSQMEMINVNVAALAALTRLFLPQMIRQKSGRILNVASTAAFQPGPLMAVYYASKAFVVSFSEALSNELEGSGVTVTAFCPGPTQTDFNRRAGLQGTRLVGLSGMTAPEAVAVGVRGMRAGKRIVIPGFGNRILAFFSWLLPTSAVLRSVRWIQENRVKPPVS